MPFNLCAETLFTEMCGCGYFGVCIHRNTVHVLACLLGCPTTGVHGRPRTVSIQSYQQQCQQCTLWLKTSVQKEWAMLRVIWIRPI